MDCRFPRTLRFKVCAGKQHIEYNQIASVKAYSRTKLSFMVECGQRPESGMSRPACVAVNSPRAKPALNRTPRFAVSRNAQDTKSREPQIIVPKKRR